ncbi:hypothetical protein NXU84_20305 [Parabacteroides distasonis]|nr:hypothetical protein [Parabacteroides distasonis]
MREKPKDDTRLRHMLEAINNVIEFTTDVTFEEYSRNKILRFAVIKNLEIVGGGCLFDYKGISGGTSRDRME